MKREILKLSQIFLKIDFKNQFYLIDETCAVQSMEIIKKDRLLCMVFITWTKYR
jgi:hypothetical protein